MVVVFAVCDFRSISDLCPFLPGSKAKVRDVHREITHPPTYSILYSLKPLIYRIRARGHIN